MSDMSFKQAQELTERLELSELTLQNTLNKIEIATNTFEELSKKEKDENNFLCEKDNKIINMKILIALNIGFIFGLLTAKYFL